MTTYDEYIQGFGSVVTPINPSTWRYVPTEESIKQYVKDYPYAHINPTHTQIDLKSVLWQLNNDEQRPGQVVTMNDLLIGQPWQKWPLKDARDSSTSPDPSQGPSPDPSTHEWEKDEHGSHFDPEPFKPDGIPDIINDLQDNQKWNVIN